MKLCETSNVKVLIYECIVLLSLIYRAASTIGGQNGANFDANLCTCQNPSLCMSLEEARSVDANSFHVSEYLRKQNKTEVFAFLLQCNKDVWLKLDWTKLTTIVLASFYDPELLCHAHQHGVRVILIANIATKDLLETESRNRWIDERIADVREHFMDGINIDFEDPVDQNSAERTGLSELVADTYRAFHDNLPGCQVSIDVAWSAANIDGRSYDYRMMADFVDVMFIMSYDQQSQIWKGPCTARANSDIWRVAVGIQSFLSLGIPAEKLVLGVPWYGYDYTCVSLDENSVCQIEQVPFRGCNCSDAAGRQFPYNDLELKREQHNATYEWDRSALSPWFNYKDINTDQSHQVRYDDPRSLTYKYAFALSAQLKGVGMYAANFLDYSATPSAVAQRDTMWGLLP